MLLAFPVCSFINGLLPRRGRLRRLPASPLHACPLPHRPSTRITLFLPDRCCKFLKAEPRIHSFFPLPASTFCFPGANNALLFPFASFSAHLTLNPCQILPRSCKHTGSLLFYLQEWLSPGLRCPRPLVPFSCQPGHGILQGSPSSDLEGVVLVEQILPERACGRQV